MILILYIKNILFTFFTWHLYFNILSFVYIFLFQIFQSNTMLLLFFNTRKVIVSDGNTMVFYNI